MPDSDIITSSLAKKTDQLPSFSPHRGPQPGQGISDSLFKDLVMFVAPSFYHVYSFHRSPTGHKPL